MLAIVGWKGRIFPLPVTISEEINSKYPVDISFLIADLKYNQEAGVKICEVQHGILSTFHGDHFNEGNGGVICKNFVETLSQYQTHVWMIANTSSDSELVTRIKNTPNWTIKKGMKDLLEDPDFKLNASLPVEDASNLLNYHGLLFRKPSQATNSDFFQSTCPGIIVMDRPTHAYWIDKYKMSMLFTRNPDLAKYKPKWGLYSKVYDDNLAKKIQEDLGGEIFVIKPRGAFLGKGVIIVSSDELDATLQYILNKDRQLLNDRDPSYNHWYRDKFDSFIVEQFIASDAVSVPHLNNKIYQPTMRVAYLLLYHNNRMHLDFLGGYWILPMLSLDEMGSLNEQHKAYCKVPYYCKVDPETQAEVNEQMTKAFGLLYKEMLTK